MTVRVSQFAWDPQHHDAGLHIAGRLRLPQTLAQGDNRDHPAFG